MQRGDLGLPPDIPPGARYSAASIASRLCGGQSHGGVRVVGGEVGQLGEEEAADSHSTIRTHTAAQQHTNRPVIGC